MTLSLDLIRHTELLGYVAAALTTVAFLPQAWLSWRTRAVEGVSTTMYLLFSIGVALWGVYGLAIRSWPVVIANALTLLQAVLILSIKLRAGSRSDAPASPASRPA
jgi:MtN3 and saliva related transmembrane protein